MVVWLIIGVCLLLLVALVSHSQIRNMCLEPFFDMTSTTTLQKSKDFQVFLEFHTKQFCPVWNEAIQTTSKNDQVSLPADQRVSDFAYMKKMEKDWNAKQGTSVIFVNCSVPIDPGTTPRSLLKIMPKDGQAYVDSLTFLNDKLDKIQAQIQEAVGGISSGEIPTISTESFVDASQIQVTCTIEDDGSMNCTNEGNTISCTNEAPLTPEQLKVQEGQVEMAIQRAKTINATIPNLKPQLQKAQSTMASLKKTKADAESGAIYGVKEQERKPKPPVGHLFYP